MAYATHEGLKTELVKGVKTIALLGASFDSTRAAHGIMKKLIKAGYEIYPIRPPSPDGAKELLGRPLYGNLEELIKDKKSVDLVLVFRKSDAVSEIVQSCIKLGLKNIWCQDHSIDLEAAKVAEKAGMKVVMDDCIYRQLLSLQATPF